MNRAHTSIAVSGLGILALVAVTGALSPATGKVLPRESFVDEYVSDPYDCDGTMAIDSGEVHVQITAVVRGSSRFPHFQQHFRGVGRTMNLETRGVYTNRFSASGHDHSITDNGDGTITIVSVAGGSSRYYDQYGNFVLKDPGSIWTTVDLDYHGTPGDPSDDTEVPDSFEVLKPSTGNSDFSTRDFCDDLRQFTTP